MSQDLNLQLSFFPQFTNFNLGGFHKDDKFYLFINSAILGLGSVSPRLSLPDKYRTFIILLSFLLGSEKKQKNQDRKMLPPQSVLHFTFFSYRRKISSPNKVLEKNRFCHPTPAFLTGQRFFIAKRQ